VLQLQRRTAIPCGAERQGNVMRLCKGWRRGRRPPSFARRRTSSACGSGGLTAPGRHEARKSKALAGRGWRSMGVSRRLPPPDHSSPAPDLDPRMFWPQSFHRCDRGGVIVAFNLPYVGHEVRSCEYIDSVNGHRSTPLQHPLASKMIYKMYFVHILSGLWQSSFRLIELERAVRSHATRPSKTWGWNGPLT